MKQLAMPLSDRTGAWLSLTIERLLYRTLEGRKRCTSLTDRQVARHHYPNDLTDGEWVILIPLVRRPARRGRPRFWPRAPCWTPSSPYCARLAPGVCWLPHDFPPWQTVVYHFRRRLLAGVWHCVHEALRASVREGSGRERCPLAGVTDSQSVKTAERGPRGYVLRSASAVASDTCWSTPQDSFWRPASHKTATVLLASSLV